MNLKKNVAVIGIGRVGLPMALVLAEKGYNVFGIGRSKEKIENLLKGTMPFMEKDCNILKRVIKKTFHPTVSYEVVKDSQIIILTLGTPIDENMNPVLSQIENVLNFITPFLRKGQLIILRSTVSPDTTRYVKEKIEIESKFTIGKDLFLACCPERVAEGNAIKEIIEIPQIIGGVDKKSTEKAKEFFESFNVKCLTTDATSAELAKLFTNMYRYISFAIANEFMVIAENYGRNMHEIIELVNNGYKRGGMALPGLTAGPCLFKDGFFLINDNPYLDLIAASWKINEAIPLFLINKIKERTPLLKKKVVILGLSFKPEIDDIRESLSFKIRKALLREHSQIFLHDPFVKKYKNQKIFDKLDDVIPSADVVIIATRHNAYVKNRSKILKMIKKDAFICDIWNLFEKRKLVFKK